MPELPEVESIARSLREGYEDKVSLLGQEICSVSIFWPGFLVGAELAEFTKLLPGQNILAIGRRAKFLTLQLSHDKLAIHLRMSGDLRVHRGQAVDVAKHDHLHIHFASGNYLAYNDPRKFGRVYFMSDLQALFARLGPEPLDPSFTPKQFHARLKSRSRLLKPLLLDQSFLAGLGNIYTDEALFDSALHPLRTSDSLSSDESTRLFNSIRKVLLLGIQHNGASIDWVYRGGDFQNYFQVYQQTGQPCPRCGTPLQRILVGQRGTHFCPHCQQP